MRKLNLCASLLILTILIPLNSYADLRMATVSGNAFLEGETDHSGVMVVFSSQSASATTDTAYTTSDGRYAIGLSDGVYDIKFSKDGFLTNTYPEIPTLSGDEVLNDITLQAGEIIPGGNVSGIWEGNRTYYVDGTITILAGDTLIIQPGSRIMFNGNYTFDVRGLLVSQGTTIDSILFSSNMVPQNIEDWNGIKFWYSANDNSVISFAEIEYADCGVECYNSSPTISSNTISNNSYGIYMGNNTSGSPTISSNTISNNSYGIYMSDYSSGSPTITGNAISNNNVNGIVIRSSGSPTISSNTISNNESIGIVVSGAGSSTITGNTTSNNYRGIVIYGGSSTISYNIISNNSFGILAAGSPTVTNNTISNNTYGIDNVSSGSAISNNVFDHNGTGIRATRVPTSLTYNLFWQNIALSEGDSISLGFGEIITQNLNGDSTDTYFNLFIDPLFVSPDSSNYYLTENSPCIDAASPDSLDADGTIRDIGAYFFNQGMPVVPESNFTSNATSGSIPLYIQFTNTTIGAVISYDWVFGDNTTSTQANPVHAYTIAGVYSVSLTATGPGGVDTEVKTDYITVTNPHYPPEVSFAGSPVSGVSPLDVNFSSAVINDLDSLRWYFGDGGTSIAANPTHTFQNVGTYSVVLHAYGPYGTDTETKTNYINVIAPNAVSAGFSALPLTGIAPMGVQFNNSSVGTIDSVRWHFGDGVTSTNMNPAHEYQFEGVYTVSLNVFGPVNNDVMTSENYVTVYDARPIITSVTDVPDDQGGKVFLRWDPSGFDGVVGNSISQYSLWQAYGEDWISINNTLATQSQSYTYLASTFGDSTNAGLTWSRFKIIAHTSNPATFFTSPVDSGYSIDNIPPEAPGQLLATASESDVSLEWGGSNEANFMYYKVFRNWDVISELSSSQYVDTPTSFMMPLYYQVASVDDAGNESPGTNEVLVDHSNLSWFVNIRAGHGGGYNDNDNFIGVVDGATDTYDVDYDVFEPPMPPNGYVGLYFPHPEWNHPLGNNFTQDIKPDLSLVDTLQTWNFEVTSDQAGAVELTFLESDAFPADATVILKNIDSGDTYLIADGQSVSVVVSPQELAHFSITIGNNSPDQPTNVSLNSPTTTGFASLTWDDNSDNEEGFLVYESMDGGTYSLVDSLDADVVIYNGASLSDLEVNTQYHFRVNSYNLAATSMGSVDSLFTLSSTPLAPIFVDSTLTTMAVNIDENGNPPSTEFAIGISGGIFGEITHYVQSDGAVLGDTSPAWATQSTWDTIDVNGLAPETEYMIMIKSRNGNLIETPFSPSISRFTGGYPTVTLLNPHGPAILLSETEYTVDWVSTNPAFVDSTFLYYSADSGATYSLVSSLGNVMSGVWTTPAEYLTYGGKIKVVIKDESGLYRDSESEAPFVVVGDSLASPIETGWSLWGVPLTPYVSSMEENFADDFSGGWWSFAYSNDGYLINVDLNSAEGYWLATDASAVVDVLGQPATTAMTIELVQGWELLTNPLVTEVNKDSLTFTRDGSTISFSDAVSSGWVSSEFYSYSQALGGYEMPNILRPWSGYWLGVIEDGVSMTFPVHQGAIELSMTNRETLTDSDWKVLFEVAAGSAHDIAIFGVDSNATDQFDVAFDVPKPPESPNPENVLISFNHPDWNPVLGDMYLADIRSPLEDPSVKEWEIQLSSTIEDSLISLSWTLDSFPEDMALTIENGTDDIDLLQQTSIEIPFSSEIITLIVRAEKSPVSVAGGNVTPTEFALYQNFPNPFNPSTTIRYGLPEDSNVSLVIYDVLGNNVQTLESGRQTAGWYNVVWNGQANDGRMISTGIYFARIVAGDYSEVIKMLYLK